MIQSFDVWSHNLPCIEIYGTEGSLQVPDPNGFGGLVKVRGKGDSEWREVESTHPYQGGARGIGMADMALAIQTGRDHRCNERVAYHVLDAMHALHDAAEEGRTLSLQSTCERPAAVPETLRDGELDT
jgi:predicted dehydrogenase